MTVLITMAGMGTRFAREGFTVPKYKIRAKGRSLFEWSMLSLREFFADEFVFATLEGEDELWLMAQARELGISRSRVISRVALSKGQAQTAYDVACQLGASGPLWIYNIDTYVANGMKPSDMDGFAGCLHVFNSKDPGMSFVNFNALGDVNEIAEKRVISNWATVGMYGFESVGKFCEIYEEAYEQYAIEAINAESYIAPMYELMIREGARVCAPKLEIADVHILGTPSQLQSFDALALPPFGRIG